MIAFMKGTLAGIEETKILLEHDGIGYEIFIPMDGRVDRLYTGQELMVHTYLAWGQRGWSQGCAGNFVCDFSR